MLKEVVATDNLADLPESSFHSIDSGSSFIKHVRTLEVNQGSKYEDSGNTESSKRRSSLDYDDEVASKSLKKT